MLLLLCIGRRKTTLFLPVRSAKKLTLIASLGCLLYTGTYDVLRDVCSIECFVNWAVEDKLTPSNWWSLSSKWPTLHICSLYLHENIYVCICYMYIFTCGNVWVVLYIYARFFFCICLIKTANDAGNCMYRGIFWAFLL